MDQLEDTIRHIDLGASIGKAQAFATLANKSSGAQAAAIREIRDAGTYKLMGLSWEDFCPRYIGLSRPCVDRMIQNLEEFGQTYFRLSEIAHVPPAIYRRMQPQIDGDSLAVDGERVPIVPENAARIREAVHELRVKLQRSAARDPFSPLTLGQIRPRLLGVVIDIENSIGSVQNEPDREQWSGTLQDCIDRLTSCLKQVSPNLTVPVP